MGYGQFAPSPFILPSITPSPFPIKHPDDGGSLLITLAAGRSQSFHARDDETPIYGAEIASIERSRMLLQQENFVRRENAAPLPDWHFPPRFIAYSRYRDSHSIDENFPPSAADFITSHAHDTLDERNAWRQIATPFNELFRPFRQAREHEIAT